MQQVEHGTRVVLQSVAGYPAIEGWTLHHPQGLSNSLHDAGSWWCQRASLCSQPHSIAAAINSTLSATAHRDASKHHRRAAPEVPQRAQRERQTQRVKPVPQQLRQHGPGREAASDSRPASLLSVQLEEGWPCGRGLAANVRQGGTCAQLEGC